MMISPTIDAIPKPTTPDASAQASAPQSNAAPSDAGSFESHLNRAAQQPPQPQETAAKETPGKDAKPQAEAPCAEQDATSTDHEEAMVATAPIVPAKAKPVAEQVVGSEAVETLIAADVATDAEAESDEEEPVETIVDPTAILVAAPIVEAAPTQVILVQQEESPAEEPTFASTQNTLPASSTTKPLPEVAPVASVSEAPQPEAAPSDTTTQTANIAPLPQGEPKLQETAPTNPQRSKAEKRVAAESKDEVLSGGAEATVNERSPTAADGSTSAPRRESHNEFKPDPAPSANETQSNVVAAAEILAAATTQTHATSSAPAELFNSSTTASVSSSAARADAAAQQVAPVDAKPQAAATPPVQAPAPSERSALPVGLASLSKSQNASKAEGQLTEVERVRFVQRVARAVQSAGDRGGDLKLRLSPPELGSLKLEVSVRDGVMNARIETETSAARSLLVDNLPALRDRLAEQNIKLDRFDVDVHGDGAGTLPDRTPDENAGSPRRHVSPENEKTAAKRLSPAETPLTPQRALRDGRLNIVV